MSRAPEPEPLTVALEHGALRVSGMDCASCVSHVERAARKLIGVADVSVSLTRGRASIAFDPTRVDLARIASAVSDAGYASVPESDEPNADGHEHEDDAHARAWRRRAIIGVALWAPAEALHWVAWLAGRHAHGISWMTWFAFATSTLAIALVGSGFYRSAWAALRRGTSNMDTLIAMGATVAYGYSLAALAGTLAGRWALPEHLYFAESSALLALISVGHWLETRARDRAGAAIRGLLELAPPTALRLPPAATPKKRLLSLGVIQPDASIKRVDADEPEEVPLRDVVVGDRLLVRPGMRVPIDGVVERGASSVDESMLTGESMPVARGPGDEVIGGTTNRDGALVVRVARVGAATALAQIVRLVDEAQSAKPAVQRLADRVSAVFVPCVLGVALLVGVGWYAWATTHGWDARQTWGTIANNVCSVLIIACPCALGIALPAALMVSTGWGARHGILIRSLESLQRGERVRRVVLDKTGTVTAGTPRVTRVRAGSSIDERELLRLAASAESHSEHPLAAAIVAHARSLGLALAEPADFANEPGVGVGATVDGRRLSVGQNGERASARGQHDAHEEDDATGATRVDVVEHLTDQTQRHLGTIWLRDEPRPDSRAAIAALHALGVDVVMLTGDRPAVARAVADAVGIGRVIAGVRPDGKAAAIVELRADLGPGEAIVMVGDGVNDAPALAAADLGIAVGSGADVAKQSAGVVLVGDSLRGVVDAVRLSRATMRVVRQNLFFAFAYNVLAIPAAALGYLNPAVAAAAMALSDVTVIGNALRIRRTMDRGRAAEPSAAVGRSPASPT